jgi:hypothetical protein
MIPNWTLFSAWHRPHLIVGEYRLDGDLIFVRDQRGSVKMKRRDRDPALKDASQLLLELAYGC